jgi:type I restriction enzyme S subunit
MSSEVETARANLSLGDVRRLLMAIPQDEEEQHAIADRLEALRELIQAKEIKITALQRLKKSLMQNLLTGRMRLSPEVIADLAADAGREKSGGA